MCTQSDARPMDFPSFVGYALEVGKAKELAVRAGSTLALKQVALSKPLKPNEMAVVSVSTVTSKTQFVVCTLSAATPQSVVELMFSPSDGGKLHLSAPKGCTVHVSAAQFADDVDDDDESDVSARPSRRRDGGACGMPRVGVRHTDMMSH